MPRSTSSTPPRSSRPSWRTSARAAPPSCATSPSGSTASARCTCGCPRTSIAAAVGVLDPDVRSALEETIRRVRQVHGAQRPGRLHRRARARARRSASGGSRSVASASTCPGGLAVYPSSVVMNVVAAQAAGVGSLAVASPPQKDQDGLPDPVVLATCALLGVDEVYAVGGAQAIAMFAYGAAGTDDVDGETLCEPVDVVTGPGNVYVAAAKRLVRGIVGIDAEAGPDRDRDPRRRHGGRRRTSPRTWSPRPSTTRWPPPSW